MPSRKPARKKPGPLKKTQIESPEVPDQDEPRFSDEWPAGDGVPTNRGGPAEANAAQTVDDPPPGTSSGQRDSKKRVVSLGELGIPASDRIPARLRDSMKNAIATHGGNEVLFVCSRDAEGKVTEIAEIAHGAPGMVPAPRKLMPQGTIVIHNHPSGVILPSDADVRVAADLADDGIASWIVDSGVTRVYVITEAFPLAVREEIPIDDIAAMLEPGGALSRKVADYSPRASQIAMLRLVSRAFNEDKLLAVEAGTGVGKTFAYLLPAVFWALRNKERVVISTATINLQQQIMDKDIPLVASLLREEVKAVVAKGRGNYVCTKRLSEALEEDSLLREEDSELGKLAEWARVTRDGSKGDLGFIPDEAIWTRINADADACPGTSCALREQCFFFRARREAASAQVIIANHHLLFADAAMRGSGLGFEGNVVLPAFRRLIFDEAHNIEANATNYFSQTLNKWMVLKILNLLLRKKRGRSFGILPQIYAAFSGGESAANPETLESQLADIRDAMRVLDEKALAILADQATLRLTPDMKPRLSDFVEGLRVLQKSLLSAIESLQDLLQTADEDRPGSENPSLVDLQGAVRRLSALAASCEALRMYDAADDKVIWIERQRNGSGDGFAHMIACPLDISPLLRESIFKPYPTVVMTSATLTVDGNFEFWSGRLGLLEGKKPKPALPKDEWGGYESGWDQGETEEESRVLYDAESGVDGKADSLSRPEEIRLRFMDRDMMRRALPSPFDYANRVLLAVPVDAPEPGSEQYQEYLNDFLSRALEISGGRALLLFTSYDMLLRTYEAVSPRLDELGIAALRQGQTERSKLLRQFNADVSSTLFATESFWEGVDSPGQTLEMVVLCRLPFRVPTEPLQLARSEAIRARGGNPFMEMSVPEAIVKFRQGFGRLMRRGEDYGVVLVPDRRLTSKFYGRSFLDSLPKTRREFSASSEILEDLGTFLGRMRRVEGAEGKAT